MSKTIFIATAEPYSGKSIIALGLVDMLLKKAKKVGYFKPIIKCRPAEQKDTHTQTIIEHFKLDIAYEDAYAYTRHEAIRMIEAGKQGEIIDTIIDRFKKMEENYDFTLIEGSDFLGEGTLFEFDANLTIAKNLAAPVIIVVSGEDKTIDEIINGSLAIKRNFRNRDVQVLSLVINKVNPEQVEELGKRFAQELKESKSTFSIIPEDRALKSPTLREIKETLDASLIAGEQHLSNQADHFIVGAMHMPNFLQHIKENVLIVTPGDRSDLIMGALQAHLSSNYPSIAGIVLSGGFKPEEPIIRLIEGLDTVVPIMTVETASFETATRIAAIQSRIMVDNRKKIALAINTFKKYTDVEALVEKMVHFKHEGLTPHMFQYQLVKMAKSSKKHIVLPEGNEDRILKAVERLLEQNIVEITLLGDPAQISSSIKRLGLKLDTERIHIINPQESDRYDNYVETLYELRKDKGVQMEMARDMMTDVSYFGTMMVYKGQADGMVSGAVHTTMHTIRPALQFIKTKPGASVVSSIFFMCLPDRVSVFGDCAVVPNPNAEQLAEIALSSAVSSKRFGIEPRVAMLSYSSGSSGEGADVDKVRKATAIVKEKKAELKVEGPIQYDAAVDPRVGQQKMPNSAVAGRASVLIFPDLNTGNNTYKAVQRETGALAIGPMLQGLKKPVNDLSRGCTAEDIFNTVLITAIQAQEES